MSTKKRYFGIDLSKRSMEVAIVTDGSEKILRKTYSNTIQGKNALLKRLKPLDTVALETGNGSFILARLIESRVSCKVHVLNAGRLHIIFESLKKTDKSDALNLARFVQRHPEDELPTVTIPSEEEMAMRSSVVEQERINKSRTASINALKNLYWNNGIVDLKLSELKDSDKRNKKLCELPEAIKKQAKRLMDQMDLCESQLMEIDKEQEKTLKADLGQTIISMSVPGIGPKNAFALKAFLGNMDRFDHSSQVTHYVGYTPRVSCSGDRNHYGSITKRGPKQLRRLLNQAAWAAVRTKEDNSLKQFYEQIKVRRGKARAVVALSRKILVILFALHKTQTLYRRKDRMEHEKTIKKLIQYGLMEKISKKT